MTQDPYARIMQSVLIQAIKDYQGVKISTHDSYTDDALSKSTRTSLREWVSGSHGSFDLCALAMNMPHTELQEKVLKLFDQIDNLKSTSLYKIARINLNDAYSGKELKPLFGKM